MKIWNDIFTCEGKKSCLVEKKNEEIGREQSEGKKKSCLVEKKKKERLTFKIFFFFAFL